VSISNTFAVIVNELATNSGIKTRSDDDMLAVATTVMAQRGASTTRVDPGAAPKRYIVAPRPHQNAAAGSVQASLRMVEAFLAPNIVRSAGPAEAKVIAMNPFEAGLLKERFGSLLIEEDLQHLLRRSPLVPELGPIMLLQSGSRGLQIRVRVGGAPLPGVRVVLRPRLDAAEGYEATSGADGIATFSVRKADNVFAQIFVEARARAWSTLLENVPFQPAIAVDLRPIVPDGFDWGHRFMCAQKRGENRGKGVKVAVIDSGIARHPHLNIGGGRNFILGEDAEHWDQDLDGHGTHCAGVIAAVEVASGTWGWAPEVELYALRVFGGDDGGGHASDIAAAIDWAVAQGCDIVNMSLGSKAPSSFLRSAIERAAEKGVLCVAAAGNQGCDQVNYPAAFEHVIGVSAVGRREVYPQDSLHRAAETALGRPDSGYYFASFSNWGPTVDFCAPGVAITSTVPADAFGAWDGTSMATPHVAGIAAVVLQTSPDYRTPVESRATRLREHLTNLAVDLGISPERQGAGLLELRA
jgi:subtilisin family serine protease